MEFVVFAAAVLSFFLFLPSNCHSLLETGDENIILNPTFDDGLNNWSGKGCKILLKDSMEDGKILPKSGKYFVTTSDRTQDWNGIQQEITARVQRKFAYELFATVRLFGKNATDVDIRAVLWVHLPDNREHNIEIVR